MILYVTLKLETKDETIGAFALAMQDVRDALKARGVKASVFQVRDDERRVALGTEVRR
ncbi:MAG TPA: hypothetical protein VMI75_32230 [Polyangiaceae bacterium]|nr:hypothetical protein [Polyangiaceae bacterium]